ncbi:hypothetical protein BDV93DRAFT_555483 [Ceratobasidium sp. AG-I]|nr:hypothetical protein BDV93DRAFT_555483 [Ceratobasidium sp. AG-I]
MATRDRPAHYPYSFKALLDVPRRLFNPPRAKVKVGRVRSMSLTPLFEVKLSDVLDGQHLPPLSKKDFEEYLLFVEHSPENLYFIQWLQEYSQVYNAWVQRGTPYSPQLALSWSRAKETFFTEGAHLRLNINASSLDGLLISTDDNAQSKTSRPMSAQLSSNSHVGSDSPHPSYPSPSAFTTIRNEVEDMLRESLVRFVCGSCGNSGRARGLFGIALGVITIVIGLAPVLVSVLQGKGGRAVRVAAIPLFWLGAWVTIMSLHGVCILIFLFGDARQLYPYELARPKITPPMTKPQGGVTIGTMDDKSYNASEKSQPVNESQLYVNLERGKHMSTCSSTSTFDHKAQQGSSGAKSPALALARDESCELSIMTSPSATTPRPVVASPTSAQALFQPPPQGMQSPGEGVRPPSPSAHQWAFDFDALPTSTAGQEQWGAPAVETKEKGSNASGIPTFGPLTRVLSPIVTRAQWEIVIRSAVMAVFVALILGGICLAIPARR